MKASLYPLYDKLYQAVPDEAEVDFEKCRELLASCTIEHLTEITILICHYLSLEKIKVDPADQKNLPFGIRLGHKSNDYTIPSFEDLPDELILVINQYLISIK